MSSPWKNRLFRILETSAGGAAGKIVNGFLILLIVLNVVMVTLQTVRSFAAKHGDLFWRFEVFSVLVFTIEYFLRAWVATENPAYRRPVAGRIRYLLTPRGIIDFVAIAPFYMPMFIPANLLFLRALRLMRLMRLLKLGRYSESIRMMGAVIRSKREAIVVSLGMSLILLFVASSLMYLIEGSVQPQTFSSVPATMWWAVETMTTVGYGDVYPVTPAGKVLAGVIALLGISLFILPAGIIAAGYAAEIQRRKAVEIVCPKCGNVMS